MQEIEPPLDPEERDRLLDRMAQQVHKRRLEVPAVLFLELHRPLAFLGSQLLVAFTPMLGPALGVGNLQKVTALLRDRENLERLVHRIESLAAASEAVPGAPEAAKNQEPGQPAEIAEADAANGSGKT